MAAVIVQSRFAGLKIEDDDISPIETQKPKNNKTNTTKKVEPAKKIKNTNNNNKSQTGPKKRKPKPSNVTTEQWEMWKQKDEELVHGSFECELQQAILLSKLDYEEKKDVYKLLKKGSDAEKKVEQSRSGNKKNKKKTVMSLEQFKDLGNTEDEKLANEQENNQHECQINDKDTKFFERVQDEAKHELLKDKIIERVLNQPVPEEFINRFQFVEALEKKDKEILSLKEEVKMLKGELLTVKSRNKKLCNILGQGEMKDKAEVLVEVERLRGVQNELNAELASLHSELEKERSKNADTKYKDKRKTSKKKTVQFDVSSEALLTKETSSTTKKRGASGDKEK